MWDFCHMTHRLDRGASGLVLFVLARGIMTSLATAWTDGTVRRSYIAVVNGTVPFKHRQVLQCLRKHCNAAMHAGHASPHACLRRVRVE
jgi:23S rRNA-/tRNA-specific pseudouridylate synthase